MLRAPQRLPVQHDAVRAGVAGALRRPAAAPKRLNGKTIYCAKRRQKVPLPSQRLASVGACWLRLRAGAARATVFCAAHYAKAQKGAVAQQQRIVVATAVVVAESARASRKRAE